MGEAPLLLSFIVVILGGLGNLAGTLAAALVDRARRRHRFGVLLADPGQDHRHPGGRAGARLASARTVRRAGAVTRRIAEPGALLLAGVIAVLFALQFAVSDYHHLSLARIMVLAAYAAGYNLLFGYTGLLSLGHAMFFAAGLYGAGLASRDLAFAPPAAFLAGVAGRPHAVVPGRPGGAAHHRRVLHDRVHDARPGLFPAHPAPQRRDGRR